MATLLERFESKVERIPESGCWIWVGDAGRYGHVSFGTPPNQHRRAAHRVSYELFRGPIPEHLNVCHHCDVTLCVNPDHLFLGTQKDNVLDSVLKHRWAIPGRRLGQRKLTDQQVKEILRGGSTSCFAKQFGVALSTIKRVKNGRTWKHLR